MVLKVGILITWEPNELLDECHKTKLPGIIGLKFDKIGLLGVYPKFWTKRV